MTVGTVSICIQLLPTLTHPAVLAGRIAVDQCVVGHVFRHHRACAHHGVAAHGYAADNSAIGSETGPAFDEGGAGFVHPAYMGARVDDIGKDHAGAAEHIVLQSDPLVDADIVLDFTTIAHTDLWADDHILTDGAIFSDAGTGQDMTKMPNLGALSDADRSVDVGTFMGAVGAHAKASCKAVQTLDTSDADIRG